VGLINLLVVIWRLTACLLLSLFIVATPSYANGFNFDFQQDQSNYPGGYIVNLAIMNSHDESICNRDGNGACTTNTTAGPYLLTGPCGPPHCNNIPYHDESTSMIYGIVDVQGTRYLHMIIGDPASGFAQDVYIRGTANATDSYSVSTWAAEHNTGFNSDPTVGTGPLQGGGNGSAHPEKVMVRQILGGRWDDTAKTWHCDTTNFCSEFLKENLLTKPKITQKVFEPDMTSEFVLDMRTVGYNDMSTQLSMVNKVDVTSEVFFYGDEGHFDIAEERVYKGFTQNSVITKNSVVTAGRYTYQETADVETFGAGGTYQYWDDSVDIQAIDWCTYYVRDQNDPNAKICK